MYCGYNKGKSMTDNKPNATPTMKDVAKVAGVSVATVSRVINGSDGVSPKLEKKVNRAMKKLHYHPSSVARSFKIQQTMLVGVIVPLIDHPFYSRLAMAIEQKLFQHDYRAIICNSEEDEVRERAYIEMLLRQRVDGLIINSAVMRTSYFHELEELKIPYVLIDRDLPEAECSKVFGDNSQGGYIGMEHLINLGHRRIGVIGAPAHIEGMIRRIRGTREALADYGIDADPELLVTGDTQLFGMGYNSANQLMSLDNPPTAIFALTDVTAVGVMHAVTEHGLRIPEDISVLGYDNIPIASYMIPQLSTVEQPIIRMGETAVELLLNHMNQPDHPIEKAVLQTQLIVRKTTSQIST
jgi:LacI family transcriptional regulator